MKALHRLLSTVLATTVRHGIFTDINSMHGLLQVVSLDVPIILHLCFNLFIDFDHFYFFMCFGYDKGLLLG